MTEQPKAFAALRHPGYRAFFIVTSLAMMGDTIEHFISYWIIFKKFQSPELAGFAMLSHWLPSLFFGPWAGALADRFDPKRIIQVAMLCFMTASLGWGLLFLADTIEMWHAMALLVIHGCASMLWSPATQVLIHDIVGPSLLHSAVRLSATGRWGGMMIGPAIGAVFFLLFGAAWGILLNVLVFVPALWWLWKAPYGPAYRKEAMPRRAFQGLRDVFLTLKEISGNWTLVSMLLLPAAASFFIGSGYQPHMPEFAHDLGHGDPGLTYSALIAADAAGALVAGLVLEARGLLHANPRTAIILAMLWGTAMAAFAAASAYPLALVLLFVAGFLELAYNAMAQTIAQMQAPGHIRGRVMGLYAMGALGMRAFSGVTIGFIGGVIGIHWSLALSGLAVMATASALLAFTVRSR
jgi:MFS family permease